MTEISTAWAASISVPEVLGLTQKAPCEVLLEPRLDRSSPPSAAVRLPRPPPLVQPENPSPASTPATILTSPSQKLLIVISTLKFRSHLSLHPRAQCLIRGHGQATWYLLLSSCQPMRPSPALFLPSFRSLPSVPAAGSSVAPDGHRGLLPSRRHTTTAYAALPSPEGP